MDMFQHMVDENGLMPRFLAAGLTELDLIFIKEQIAGPCPDTGKYVGRTGQKAFLYEVSSVWGDRSGSRGYILESGCLSMEGRRRWFTLCFNHVYVFSCAVRSSLVNFVSCLCDLRVMSFFAAAFFGVVPILLLVLRP